MAKVKVLGKGEAGLAQLEKYIPKVRYAGAAFYARQPPVGYKNYFV